MKVKSIRHIVWIIILAANPAASQNQQTEQFNLKNCIQYSLQHNPKSTIYANNVRISEQKITESRAALLPSINANVGVDYNMKLATSVIPAGTFGASETKLQMGNKFSTAAYVQADWSLLDRSAYLGIQSAKVDKEIAELTVLRQNEDLIYNTATTYYNVLIYSEKRKLLIENQNQYKQLLPILKLRYDQGVIKKSEYDRTRINLGNIEAELALNESNYLLALNQLKNAIGMDIKANLMVQDSLNYSDPIALMDISDFNQSNLLSYKVDEKNLLLKKIDIEKKRAAFLPTLSIYGKYGANVYGKDLSTAFTDWFDYSTIGLKLSVPVFSGLKRTSQLKQSKLNVNNQLLTSKLNTSDYDLSFENNRTQLKSSYTSLLKNKDNMQLAKELLEASNIEYQSGTTSLSNFLDSSYSYKEAQTNYITSLLNFLSSQISLEKASGTLTNYVNNLK
jgi:outer membrane protein